MVEDYEGQVDELAHSGPQTHWIKTSEENREFLESVGVVLGPREGGYWRLCVIPDERELLDYWGSGDEDTIMFGKEGEERERVVLGEDRERVYCSLCDSAIMRDGTCSYPLCPSWQVEESEPEAEEAEPEPEPERPRAARLRQN